MMHHNLETSHAVCICLEDLSIWCYGCMRYLGKKSYRSTSAQLKLNKLDYGEHENLRQIYKSLLQLKFGEDRQSGVSEAKRRPKRKRAEDG